MSKKIVLASVATMLVAGGMAYGLSSFVSQSEPCPLEGTPACPKNTAMQAGMSANHEVVASGELRPCCKAK